MAIKWLLQKMKIRGNVFFDDKSSFIRKFSPVAADSPNKGVAET